jgi:UDP-2-acetamido-2,6-beta-L-arabino-hexul-4-ose reductase
VHAQEVASRIVAAITAKNNGTERLQGRRTTVSQLLVQLREMDDSYRKEMVIPRVSDPFDLALFNTFRSYLYPQHYPVLLEIKSDARGGLFEAAKTLHGGQCFLSYSKPGITRGNHYHAAKIERFLVVKGEAIIRLRRLFFREAVEFKVSGMKPSYIDMPTFHVHNITNIGKDELLVLFWAHEIFDPSQPDTYAESV